MPNVNAVIAKLEASAGAEPAPEANSGAPLPAGDASGAGSAPADPPAGGDAAASPGATNVHAELEAKLQADRERRGTKAERRAARLAREKAEALHRELEEQKRAEAAERERRKGMSWLERAKADGKDPREAFEEMRAEALKAGTPDAQIEAIQKLFDSRMADLEKQLTEERQERQRERSAIEQERRHRAFVADFETGMKRPEFGGLLEEYEPPELFRVISSLRSNPKYLFQQAEQLGVRLTADDGGFSMIDILNVMKATQDRHRTRQEQRRKRSAEPQASEAGETQPPAATKPTVNGTAVRNAGNTIGNDLAATRATEAEQLKSMTHEQRRKLLERKYG